MPDKSIKLFLDTEFTDLSKQGELMSLALLENEQSFFYGEITDNWPERLHLLSRVRPDQSDWIKANVISNFLLDPHSAPYIKTEGKTYLVKGERDFVRIELAKFICRYYDIELVCDGGFYDMMHFVDLFGDAKNDLPKNISPIYWELNQKLAEKNKTTIREAFLNHEGGGHNALDDALKCHETWNKLADSN